MRGCNRWISEQAWTATGTRECGWRALRCPSLEQTDRSSSHGRSGGGCGPYDDGGTQKLRMKMDPITSTQQPRHPQVPPSLTLRVTPQPHAVDALGILRRVSLHVSCSHCGASHQQRPLYPL